WADGAWVQRVGASNGGAATRSGTSPAQQWFELGQSIGAAAERLEVAVGRLGERAPLRHWCSLLTERSRETRFDLGEKLGGGVGGDVGDRGSSFAESGERLLELTTIESDPPEARQGERAHERVLDLVE